MIDLVNQRFGRLIVESLARKHRGKVWWHVLCNCGQRRVSESGHLRSGHTKSCGCIRKGNIYIAKSKQKELQRIAATEKIANGYKSCRRKECTQNNPQPLDCFTADNRALDGKQSRCRTCGDAANTNRLYGKGAVEIKKRLIIEQDGKCANPGCRYPLVGKGAAHLDHNHVTGALRGVLCRLCNLALGHLGDSPDRIQGLLDYAIRHGQLMLLQGGKK